MLMKPLSSFLCLKLCKGYIYSLKKLLGTHKFMTITLKGLNHATCPVLTQFMGYKLANTVGYHITITEPKACFL